MFKFLDEVLDKAIQLPAFFLFTLQIIYAIFVLLVLACFVLLIAMMVKQEHWTDLGNWLKSKVNIALRIPTGKM